MQDRYFGDVGDFGKYGLLRSLCGLDNDLILKLGMVWYLFPDEGHNADGKNFGYLLKPREYRDCDEQLFLLLPSPNFRRATLKRLLGSANGHQFPGVPFSCAGRQDISAVATENARLQ